MGMRIFKFSDSSDNFKRDKPSLVERAIDAFLGRTKKNIDVNPDPARFHIIKEQHVGHAVVVRIRYPDCTPFDGNKILVYDDVEAWRDLLNSGVVDPHFLEGTYSPIARFQGTDTGWQLAVAFAAIIA